MNDHVGQEAGKKINFYFANELRPACYLVFKVKQIGPLDTEPNRSVQQLFTWYILVSVLYVLFNFLL